ncbi:MAG TPA: helix-turn-helix transcriptional regulator [Verrucomicrobiae bacterium]|jgi:transcriptional regulator with XRE-family HTH domain
MVSKRDQAICARLRTIREVLGYSQGEVAEALHATRERIAAYEHARAPIRFHFGNAFCSTLHINQHWFATGEGLISPYIENAHRDLVISDRALFSEIYDDKLKAVVVEATQSHWSKFAKASPARADGRVVIRNEKRERARGIIHDLAEDWLASTPPDLLDELVNRLLAAGEMITRDIVSEKIRTIRS